MSLPSIPKILKKMGRKAEELSPAEQEQLLVDAMRTDLGPALKFLHKLAHEAQKNGSADWLKKPKSRIGQQLIRIHASDAMRPLAEKHFCHGLKLTFVNCCGGTVGKPPDKIILRQIQCQDGTIARPDC